MAKKTTHYVNNKDFLAAMIEYKGTVSEATNSGNARPQIPSYVAECIMKIANNLSYRPNFANYSFRDEMVGDGIENCLQYIDNFNPEKSSNPFAYFTQIIYYAFLRRIQKEKKYLYTKYKATENANILGATSDRQTHDKSVNYGDDIKQSSGSQEYMTEFIENYETAERNKKNRKTVHNS
jgi:DNA-directed RNA polymerase specialized sigma24 family protein